MTETSRGGCQCSAVQYQVSGEAIAVALCHCSSCRRATGAPCVAWAMFPLDQFQLTQGEPVRHASSKGIERGFCGRCGTQISFTADFMPGLIDITVGSLEAPERCAPQMHMWESRRLGWLELADSWPRHAEWPPEE